MNFSTTSSDSIPARRYVLHWVGATLAFLVVTAVFNALVDPYGMFRIVDLRGLNDIKTRAGQRAELYKRHAVNQLHFKGLILGNSRAEIGFDPDSHAWPEAARPVFNFALPGSGLAAAHDAFAVVARANAPRFLVVGVEFLDFRTQGVAVQLQPINTSRSHQWVTEHVSALLTVNALRDSILTIAGQNRPNAARLTDAGFNPMRDYEEIARREGYRAMFAQRNQDNARGYASGAKDIRSSDGRLAVQFDLLKRLVRDALLHGTEVKLVLYPYHANSLVLFHECGLWDAFERWKRALVSLVESFHEEDRVSLWDFADFSPYTEEAVPAPWEYQREMRWYWEAGHFKKSLGDKVLARVFASRDADTSFGRRLAAESIEVVLAETRTGLSRYKMTHSSDVEELRNLVRAAQRGHKYAAETR